VKKVLIVQAEMKQYRASFFTKLNDALRQDEICLRVAYSIPEKLDGRNDNCDLPDSLGIRVKGYWILRSSMLYQPLLRQVADADLVIAQEANKHILNHLLVMLSILGLKRVALWGFGQNKDRERSEVSEWVRRRIVSKVDWYFAYTRGAVKALASNGVRQDRVTTVENSIDTREFAELIQGISNAELSTTKRQFGIEEDACIGLYCGMLSPDKGIDFLLDAAKLIRVQVPNFHVLIIGGGPEKERVMAVARSHPWIHCLGPKFGRQKAIFFKMADAFLLPGRVGLAILDAFAAELPLLTTSVPYHGPEVEYLEHGFNGLMVEHDVVAYASQVISLFTNDSLRLELIEGARDSGRKYSIDAMVSNFRLGILMCLGLTANNFAVAHTVQR